MAVWVRWRQRKKKIPHLLLVLLLLYHGNIFLGIRDVFLPHNDTQNENEDFHSVNQLLRHQTTRMNSIEPFTQESYYQQKVGSVQEDESGATPSVLIYSSDSTGSYYNDKWDNEAKLFLESLGFKVMVEDRSTIPVLNDSHFVNISQFWLMNGGDGSPLSENEQKAILDAWRNSTNLVLAGDQTGWYSNVNLIGKKFGVEYEGAYLFSNPQTPDFINHPIWLNVTTIYADPTLPQLIIYPNSSAQSLSTDSGYNQHVLFENDTGSVFWGSSFGNFMNNHISKYNNSQYSSNLARYLQEPEVQLLGATNNSEINEETVLQLQITDENLRNVMYNWGGRTNQTITEPYNIPLPMSDGWHVLNIYVQDYWNHFLCLVYSLNRRMSVHSDPDWSIWYDENVNAHSVFIEDNFAFVAAYNDGLVIINVTDPLNPGSAVYQSTRGTAYDLFVQDGYAYIAEVIAGSGGLTVVDVRDPNNPTIHGTYDWFSVDKIFVNDNHAYLGGGEQGMLILNISDPSTPTFDSTVSSIGTHDIFINNDFAYTTQTSPWNVSEDALAITNITDSKNPGDPIYVNITGSAGNLFVNNSHTYINTNALGGALAIVNVANPLNPGDPQYYNLNGYANYLDGDGSYIYVTVWEGGANYRLSVINMTDPQTPGSAFYYDLNDIFPFPPGEGICIDGDYLYIAHYNGLIAIDLIAAFDILPPEITLSSPINTTYFHDNVWLNISINELTSWVGYSLDGRENVTVILENTLLNVLQTGTHTLQVFANDTVGNMGNSEVVTFTFLREQIILEDDFEDLDIWEITNPSIMTLNTTFGNPAPSVEIVSTQADLGLCKVEEVYFPPLESGEFIRTSIDLFIPEIQVGSISVFTDITGVKFPFRLQVNNTNSVTLYIYSTGQESTLPYNFEPINWYEFAVDVYNDHFTLTINETYLTSINSTAYLSQSVPIAFGDGAQSIPEQGHYYFDNVKVSKFTEYEIRQHNPITINSDTDFVDQGWLGSGTVQAPYVITNLEINGSGGHCIQIHNTRAHFVISDCILYGATSARMAGIFLGNVSNGQIDNNTCSGINSENWNYAGIWLEFTSNIMITNNTCINDGYGIILWDLFGSASNTNIVIQNNTCSKNNHGIALYSSNSNQIIGNICTENNGDGGIHLVNSFENIIENNTCVDNSGVAGIWLLFSNSTIVVNNSCNRNNYGIFLSSSNNNELISNLCNNNSINGFWVSNSDHNTFYNNTVTFNSRGGIYFRGGSYSSDYNSISLNIFEKNSDYEACDNGTENSFDYNYWFNYTTIDIDNDGIGDNPYSISGSARNFDPHPYCANYIPSILLKNPSNYTIQNKGTVINLEIRDINLGGVLYNWDGNNNQSFYQQWMVMVPQTNGWHVLHVYANDSLGAQNHQSFQFYIDLLPPTISLFEVVNDTVVNTKVVIELNVSDASLDSVWYNWDLSNNYSLSYPFDIIIPSDEGEHCLTVFANDSFGYFSVVYFHFWVNYYPTILLYSPLNFSTIFPETIITFSINDSSLESVWYQWDSDENATLTELSLTAIDSPGWHTLVIYANDSWGWTKSQLYSFYILGSPLLEIKQEPSIVYSGENFIYSFTVTNQESISLNLTLLAYGVDDDVLQGNGSLINLGAGESKLVELTIKPKHASIHQVLITLLYNGEIYYQYPFNFDVNPQWMSPRFYVPFIIAPILLILILIVVTSISFYFLSTRNKIRQALMDEYTTTKAPVSLDKIQSSIKAPSFMVRMGIASDQNLVMTPEGKIVNKKHLRSHITQIFVDSHEPVSLIDVSKEYAVTLSEVHSIARKAVATSKLSGKIIEDILYPTDFVVQVATFISNQGSGKLSSIYEKFQVNQKAIDIAVKNLLGSDQSIFTIYLNPQQDIFNVIYISEWNNIVRRLSSSEGFTPGTIFPDLTIYNWRSICQNQKLPILSYGDRLFTIEGLQTYSPDHLDEITPIIQNLRRQLPKLSLTSRAQREILQSFEQLLPIEPVHLPYYCQMGGAMIVKEQAAFVCVECNRNICPPCYREMRETGMVNCINCGGDLVERPALQIEVDIERVDQMTGHEFENFLEGLFRTQMYRVENIQSSGDLGVDLVVVKGETRTGVQAKRFKPSSKIGNQVLVTLKGGGYFHDCDKLMVVTTSYFTPKAKEYAQKVGIELWDRDVLRRYLTKYNEHLQDIRK